MGCYYYSINLTQINSWWFNVGVCGKALKCTNHMKINEEIMSVKEMTGICSHVGNNCHSLPIWLSTNIWYIAFLSHLEDLIHWPLVMGYSEVIRIPLVTIGERHDAKNLFPFSSSLANGRCPYNWENSLSFSHNYMAILLALKPGTMVVLGHSSPTKLGLAPNSWVFVGGSNQSSILETRNHPLLAHYFLRNISCTGVNYCNHVMYFRINQIGKDHPTLKLFIGFMNSHSLW